MQLFSIRQSNHAQILAKCFNINPMANATIRLYFFLNGLAHSPVRTISREYRDVVLELGA